MAGEDRAASGPADGFRGVTEVASPDVRWQMVAVLDEGGYRKKRLEDLHGQLAEIRLHPEVPEAVRVNFDTARNLMLHSWFVYRFAEAAKFLAYATLEMALRERPGPAEGLRRLLVRAIDGGLIRDDTIRHAGRLRQRDEAAAEMMGTPPATPSGADPQAYARVLAETFPSLRNDFAHGSTTLSPSVLPLELVCDLINQLYPQP